VVQRSPIGLQSHPKDRRGSRETSSHGVAREYARFPLLRHPLAVDQSTGSVSSVEVPIMQSKMRDLTDDELSALKLQRDKSLDELEKVVSLLIETTVGI